MKNTKQEKFWKSKFGKEYIKRNAFSVKELNDSYKLKFGVTRSRINKEFLENLKIHNVLEVGSSIGIQLAALQKQGFKNLYGIEVYDKAVELSKKHTKNINIIQGSAFDIPFKDNYFDLIFTSGLLIHVSPEDIKKALKEIHRVGKKYIWGFEYFSEAYEEIKYRKHKTRLWKTNFAKMYLDLFPNLKLTKEKRYKYLTDNNVDSMFLLKKK